MARLPSLSALRAFEAAARHRSFTKAANELFLTQSAVSRHIRSLEEWLQCDLFARNHRAVTLTPDGEVYMRDVVDAFAKLERATRRIMAAKSQDILRIQAYTTFAVRWLIPRLATFQTENPDIDVRLTASIQPINFAHDDIHGAIRTAPGDWGPDVRADKLFDVTLIPVCSPFLTSIQIPIRDPNELRHVTLLHSLARMSDWALWLRHAGADQVDADRGMTFESSIMANLAAQNGLGVAIAQHFLVRDELQKGVLVSPYQSTFLSDRSYQFLSSPRYRGSRVLELFREWLLNEVAKAG